MERIWKIAALTIASLVLLSSAAASENGRSSHPQAFGERAPGHFDRAEFLRQQRDLHEWLMEQQVRDGLNSPINIRITGEESRSIEQRDATERRVRVGISKAVGESVELNRSSRPALGAQRITAGELTWTTVVRSEGASALRIHFQGFSLPEGAELYLYNSSGMVRGPYTGRGPNGTGEFWSHTVFGSEVYVQVHQASARASRFVIVDVAHLGSRFPATPSEQAGHCSINESCVENAECGTNSAVNDAKDAVALILFASGRYLYICSGGLLADTASTAIPYFLTANHCVSKGREANSLETFFNFTAPCNTTDCPGIPNTSTTLGSSIAATNRTGDYTLLVLDEAPPEGTMYLGWNSAPVALSDGTPLYRISHPQGAPQAYSEHAVDTSKPTCTSWPRGNWIYSQDVVGATEGGSSGSPVVNASGQVVGQLSGACGYNVYDVCDEAVNATVDGAFANYFDEVKAFLDPTPCTPSAEVCSDGIDNNCNGYVDCADTACSSDPTCQGGSCGGHGSACIVNGDCCSGNCKRSTCKGN